MKKILFYLLTSLLLVILAACGQGTTGDKDSGNGQTAGTSVDGEKEQEQEQEQEQDQDLSYPQLSTSVADNEALVVMNTTLGAIKIKLFPEIAPKTVENFLTLAENGYYDGIIFHRVMDNFMIQGGDPTGTGAGGESIYGGSFEDEFSEEVFHFRGALSMANAGPNTNGSQFFIVQSPLVNNDSLNNQPKGIVYPDIIKEAYTKMGGTPHLDHSHTVFGQVIEGMDTVDKIAKVEANQTRPIEEVSIVSIEILQNPSK
jgi:peptidyl-prolyl cis-trans isomerase B (cyclophilin B)